MLIQRLNEAIREALASRGLDGRSCYTSVNPLPPGGERIAVECSDLALLKEVQERTRALGAEAAVEFVALPGPDLPGSSALIAMSSVADVRKEPAHSAELVTQIIYGDAVELLKDEGEWRLVRLDDGYVGWMRSWCLCAVTEYNKKSYGDIARHRVSANHAEVLSEPDLAAIPVTDLVIGTRVAVSSCPRRGWRSVVLPDGRAGYITSRAVEPIPRRRKPSRERLVATGLRFLGIPYLWGGTTPKGFDCSGLIQRVFRLNGVLLPRDSDLQASHGRRKPAGDPGGLQAGDLLFFGADAGKITHVAMMMPDGLFLHAYGQVRVGSFDPRHSLYDANLRKIWKLSRDPLASVGTGP